MGNMKLHSHYHFQKNSILGVWQDKYIISHDHSNDSRQIINNDNDNLINSFLFKKKLNLKDYSKRPQIRSNRFLMICQQKVQCDKIKFRTLCANDFGAFESDENNLD